ncbi:hypothetical protein ACFFS2_11280 [Streptomyces aurantiacus]|uniref:Secreted protein n=1 Tax=Streptomyces aurantiacus TaxID=47760 RepID=A0A7G1NZW1_9ACTN|nr:hypothetical protein [Streptomyces aurantiacus]BCL28232.1 hypothetical protein GCM10017557_30910 [Streptomyces aurantiacus]
MKRILASLGAAAVLAAGAIVTAPASASAAPNGCWGDAGTKTDPEGRTDTARYCHNYQSGDIIWYATDIGDLYAGDNWFICQQQDAGYPNPPVGDARNDWWLFTQGDTGSTHGGWGWFPATKISGGSNWEPVPGLPIC